MILDVPIKWLDIITMFVAIRKNQNMINRIMKLYILFYIKTILHQCSIFSCIIFEDAFP